MLDVEKLLEPSTEKWKIPTSDAEKLVRQALATVDIAIDGTVCKWHVIAASSEFRIVAAINATEFVGRKSLTTTLFLVVNLRE